jgi:hypothetical protein
LLQNDLEKKYTEFIIVLSSTAGVASDIDWNSMAALDFLGAPGLNQAQQPQIQAVLANTATVIYSHKHSFQHYIKVRCDDPNKRCQNRPDQESYRPKYVLPLWLSVDLD